MRIWVSLFLFWGFLSPDFAQTNDSTRTIVLTILHGSRPKRHTKEVQFLGRMYGGHVVVQVDSFCYGFNFYNNRVHPFPHKHTPVGVYEKDPVTLIYNNWLSSKVTRIYIPVPNKDYEELKDTYEHYYLNCPHDYAFFGMRCAASAYWMLGKGGVLKECSRRRSIIHAFHPKKLRRKMVRLAKKRHYTITVQKGRDTRKWEGD